MRDSSPLPIEPVLPREKIISEQCGDYNIFEQNRTKNSFKTYAAETLSSDAKIPGWKRLLDLTIILLTLPIWLLAMVCIAVWIKIVSPGPILYYQKRIGYRGRPFMIFKFRSMKVNVETQTHEEYVARLMMSDQPMTKLDSSGDHRMIRGGSILRATGLDELPQLLNVLRGEMSLVGPRPCTAVEFERYQDRDQERVDAPPGLTGYWQVKGKNKTTFSQMIELDLYYVENMSPWLDLLIILWTTPAIAAQVIESRTRAVSRPREALMEQRAQ